MVDRIDEGEHPEICSESELNVLPSFEPLPSLWSAFVLASLLRRFICVLSQRSRVVPVITDDDYFASRLEQVSRK